MSQCRFYTVNTHALLRRCSLLADGNPLVVRAHLALHVAAPVELAVTPLRPLHLQRVVAPATAQRFAIVNAGAGFVAQAARGPGRIHQRVGVAEVGRPLEVQQLHFAGPLPVPLEDPAVSGVDHIHLKEPLEE